MTEAPMRAFRLTLKLDADTNADLASALYKLAHRVECGKVSTGCWGGPTDGGIYELLTDAEMTHEKYFDALCAIAAANLDPATVSERASA